MRVRPLGGGSGEQQETKRCTSIEGDTSIQLLTKEPRTFNFDRVSGADRFGAQRAG